MTEAGILIAIFSISALSAACWAARWSMMMLIPYGQIHNTLSVFLRDVHGVPTQGYGFLMSLNAGIVVVLQFWFTRRLKRFAPMLLMVVGTILYMIGLTMYGVVALYTLFVLAMVIITFGEMIIMPEGQTLAANFAPEDMRGRYLALFGLSWTIAAAVGPTAAGLIMDNYDPDWVWYAAGILSAVAAAGYFVLYLATKERLTQPAVVRRQTLLPKPTKCGRSPFRARACRNRLYPFR